MQQEFWRTMQQEFWRIAQISGSLVRKLELAANAEYGSSHGATVAAFSDDISALRDVVPMHDTLGADRPPTIVADVSPMTLVGIDTWVKTILCKSRGCYQKRQCSYEQG